MKRLHRCSWGEAWLMSANDAHRPISAANALILGKVVAVLRKV